MKTITLLGLLIILMLSQTSRADIATLLRSDSDAMQARLDIIKSAKKEIWIEYFIFGNDEDPISMSMLAVLLEKASEGVQVHMILDSSFEDLPKSLIAKLNRVPNFEIRLFSQPDPTHITTFYKRLHDKQVNVDGQYVVMGGRNGAKDYFGRASERDNKKDLDIYIHGQAAKDLRDYAAGLWTKNRFLKPPHPNQYSDALNVNSCSSATSAIECEHLRDYMNKQMAKIAKALEDLKSGAVGYQYDSKIDWDARGREVGKIVAMFDPPQIEKRESTKDGIKEEILNIVQDIYTSRKVETPSILIVSPYVILTEEAEGFLRAITSRGVPLTLITNSSNSNDGILVQDGYLGHTRPKLIDMGAEIYEFRGPSLLHQKTALINMEKMIIGSFNFDRRSANLNREIAVFIGDESTLEIKQNVKDLVAEVAEVVKERIRSSDHIAAFGKRFEVEQIKPGRKRQILLQLLMRVAGKSDLLDQE